MRDLRIVCDLPTVCYTGADYRPEQEPHHDRCADQQIVEAARTIYVTGLPAIEVDQWGSAYFYSYLDGSLEQLRRTMEM